MRRPGVIAIAGTVLLCASLATCTGAPGSSPAGGPSSGSGPPSPAGGGGPFAGLTYRLDLPADWVVLGTSAYDTGLDATPDVARWLRDLKLAGPNEFRAYEPRPGATGLRLAINPPVTWNSDASGPLNDGDLSALPGLSGEPIGEYVAVGAAAKGARFRWTQSLDWGSGSPTARTCVGYQVSSEFDPVNVVFSYPAETDRLADVEALMTSFTVLGSPSVSLPPGATPTPSPTPYDKYGSPQPVPTPHADPALEALLPDSVDGRALTKTSRTGTELGMTDTSPVLKALGKHPADITGATAMPSEPPLLIVSVTRLRGVSADELLVAILADMPDAKASQVTLDGRPVTYVVAGAWPVWYFATGEHLYGISAMDEGEAARVLALLE